MRRQLLLLHSIAANIEVTAGHQSHVMLAAVIFTAKPTPSLS